MADTTKTLEQRLLSVQTKLKAPKGQYNSFGKYSYRNCEDILEAVKPLLTEQNLCMVISDNIEEIGGRVYVKAEVAIRDALDSKMFLRAWAYAREAEDKKGMDEAQITGAASSYARKYALNAMFLIDDTKDADSDEQREEANNRPHEVVTADDTINHPPTEKQLIAIKGYLKQLEMGEEYIAGVLGQVHTFQQASASIVQLKEKVANKRAAKAEETVTVDENFKVVKKA